MIGPRLAPFQQRELGGVSRVWPARMAPRPLLAHRALRRETACPFGLISLSVRSTADLLPALHLVEPVGQQLLPLGGWLSVPIVFLFICIIIINIYIYCFYLPLPYISYIYTCYRKRLYVLKPI